MVLPKFHKYCIVLYMHMIVHDLSFTCIITVVGLDIAIRHVQLKGMGLFIVLFL